MGLINQKFNSILPTEIVFGKGIVASDLANKLLDLNVQKVLIVSDSGLKNLGIIDGIADSLRVGGVEPFIFAEVEPNPTMEAVHQGRKVYFQHNCTGIVAIGGGSSLDAAKAIAVASVNEGDVNQYGRGKKTIKGPLPPTIMIPTTAGTGSEVTNVAVITDTRQKRKFVLASTYLIPTCAFVDPVMTYSLPPKLIAATGMDALVHSIESYVNNRAQPISDALALEAIKMLRKYLPKSYADPTNEEAKAQVLLASTIAGLSFSMSGTALVHSLSHPMTAWFEVPHGLANAIILPYVMEFNLIANYEKYAEVAYLFEEETRNLSVYKAAEKLVDHLKNFARKLDIPENFNYLSEVIDEEVIEGLTRDAMDDRGTFPNNPRKPSKEEVRALYQQLLPQYKATMAINY
ncbi:iron-containing alcohol dehydrogenase [Neobacillus sp. NPDC093182]|uniref:iron-containing alcohol dehydrogenase n=1 Tax=Neobacillus sp. NPDC093182 TaxID=3364297 RepID=UPI00382F8972